MNVLVTGGAGYIGSHTVVELLNTGHSVVILDDFSNASPKCLEKIKKISNKEFLHFVGDVGSESELDTIFTNENIDAVIHFAGFKSVSESQHEPLKYYKNNISATLTLLEKMKEFGVRKFIFSSSATVYGQPKSVPLSENARIGGTTNPYGTSKFFVEKILEDLSYTKDFDMVCLRYFNPVGAHPSGLIGECPVGVPNNLVPYLLDVASGVREQLQIFGCDYPTHDGTGVRDYIHVVDLAKGHLAAINYLTLNPGYHIFNLGTGIGYSVLDLITVFEKQTGMKINKVFSERRKGDVASCWADPEKANRLLKWTAEKDLSEMLHDSWNWKSKFPNGF